MSANYHTAWIDGTTQFRAADMNVPLSELDSKITDLDRKETAIACNYLNAVPGSNALLLRINIIAYMIIPDGAPGSIATCGVAPTAETIFTIKRNTVTLGTITFAGSSQIGVFAVSGDQPLFDGSVLSISAPASPDATISDISITLKCTSPGGFESTTTTTTITTTTTTTI